MDGPILIATDGAPGSAGALRVGFALARERGRAVEILTVLPPQNPALYGEILVAPRAYEMLHAAQEEETRDRIQAQVAELGAEPAWEVFVDVGPPPRRIAARAEEIGASVVVVGTGPRQAPERWLRSETSLRVAQLGRTPLLIVPPDATDLPASALVGVDFSRFSRQAAKTVPSVIRSGGRVVLVHVGWRPAEMESLPSLSEFWTTYSQGATARLEVLAEEVRAASGAAVEAHVVAGEPAHELLACARRFNVDLVAAGSHGLGFFDRILMGSVSTRLIRGTRGCVLIAPPATASDESGRVRMSPDESGESE